jgi:hypothetical protein
VDKPFQIVVDLEEAKKAKMGDQDSMIVHKETFDNEDAIFAGLDKMFGSLNIITKPKKK